MFDFHLEKPVTESVAKLDYQALYFTGITDHIWYRIVLCWRVLCMKIAKRSLSGSLSSTGWPKDWAGLAVLNCTVLYARSGPATSAGAAGCTYL